MDKQILEKAHEYCTEVRSWSPPNPEPAKDTYRCDICGFEILGEDNCVEHIIQEHDKVLLKELEVAVN